MEKQMTILIKKKKKHKVGGLNTPDFKTHCKVIITKTVGTGIKIDI